MSDTPSTEEREKLVKRIEEILFRKYGGVLISQHMAGVIMEAVDEYCPPSKASEEAIIRARIDQIDKALYWQNTWHGQLFVSAKKLQEQRNELEADLRKALNIDQEGR